MSWSSKRPCHHKASRFLPIQPVSINCFVHHRHVQTLLHVLTPAGVQKRKQPGEHRGKVPAAGPPDDEAPAKRRRRQDASLEPPSPAGAAAQPAAEAPVFWRGELAKSAQVQSAVRVISANAWCRAKSRAWPQVLDMQHRIAVDQMIALWHGQGDETRGWCWIAPEAPGHAGFAAFVAYLTQRQRAGIVKLPAPAGAATAQSLYLVPATEALCASLAIPSEPDAMLVLAMEWEVGS